ncbi:MAG: Omp85 family outer membrane protein [Bacteroidales bacterium]
MKKTYHAIFILLTMTLSLTAQEDKDTKTGWNFGLLPVVSYNSDLGFQYGGLTNIYFYGDGDVYPKYYHSIYAEVSRYTKGSGIFRLFYDSEFLLPGVRLTADLLYMPEQAVDFYGFNGYNAVYNPSWAESNSSEYITRMFYKHERNILRFKADFGSRLLHDNLSWALGYNFMKVDISTVDVDHLNEGQDADNMLPDTATLYDQYRNWGIIEEDEADGGFHHSFKTGLVFDSRDNEANPMQGIWTEAVLFNSFGNEYNFGKLALTHRQYFTIIKNDLSFAYRLGYQGIVWGDAPFYMYPYMVYSYMPSSTIDGLGGAKSVRGLLRNRLVSESVAFANLELRYKFWRFNFIGQNWYMALSPFMDIGRSIQLVDVDKSGIPAHIDRDNYFSDDEDFHFTWGGGLHIAMNENFVIAADIGVPFREADGSTGIYIGMNWLF